MASLAGFEHDSFFLIRDTGEHPPELTPLTFREVFAKTTYGDRNLFAASQAGLVNNLNDGMSWGVFPLFSPPSAWG